MKDEEESEGGRKNTAAFILDWCSAGGQPVAYGLVEVQLLLYIGLDMLSCG